MEKQLLTSVIEKYYLGGIHEKVKWTVKDKKVTILFTSQTKDLAGSIEAPNFDIDDCTLGIYDTNKLLKLVNITNQFIQLNVETKNGTSTKLSIADNEYDLVYHLADLRMMPMETMVLDETQISFDYSFGIDNDFIERYNKAKKALGSEFCTINLITKDTGNVISLTLGEPEGHSNKIDFEEVPLESKNTIHIPLQFNAEYLKSIFDANYGAEGTMWVSNEGAMKLDFESEDGQKSSYIILAKV